MSEPVTVQIACCNNGDRTARDVLYNISIQEGFKMTALEGVTQGAVVRSPISDLDVWVEKDEYVHPQDVAGFGGSVEVLKGRQEVLYGVEISYDYGRLEIDLKILIDDSTAKAPAHRNSHRP